MAKATDIRRTPIDFWLKLNRLYDFDLDCAANKKNALCPTWFGPGSFIADALDPDVEWGDYGTTAWLNMPYSEIPKWLAKAVDSVRSRSGFRVVCCLPNNSSAKWFHQFVWDKDRNWWRPEVASVRFVERRLTFAPHKTNAMWPTLIVEFSGDANWQKPKRPKSFDTKALKNIERRARR